MTLPGSIGADLKRARNVCDACLRRKKACDKAWPACGFCASRRRVCRYDVSEPKSQARRAYNPGRHFVPLRSPSPSPSVSLDHSSLGLLSQPLEASLHQLAQHVTEMTKLTYDNIIDHYSKAFHIWLPVVSPESLHREVSRCREGGCLPSADFTVLLLAMLLAILPTLDPSVRPPHAIQESLYRTTKSAFSQAQASICTSLRLSQAALLIALREYASVRQEAAYVSLMTCVGLARVLGIELAAVRPTRDAATIREFRTEKSEVDNLAWSVAMLERLILCEMDQRDLQPQTEYLRPDCRLPLESNRTVVGPKSTPGGPDLQTSDQMTLPSPDTDTATADTGPFGQQAQSVSLLDGLLTVLPSTAGDQETKLEKLTELDSKIRSFIEVLLADLDRRQTLICFSVALCVRLLFRLHGSILDTLQRAESEADQQKKDMSWSALDMLCRWILDVRQWKSQDMALIMPIASFYSLHAARKGLQSRSRNLQVKPVNTVLSRDIDSLLAAEEEYYQIWKL